MKKQKFSSLLLISALFALLFLAGYSLPVSAGSNGQLAQGGTVVEGKATPTPVRNTGKFYSKITLSKIDPVDLSKSFALTGTLEDEFGRPIPDRAVQFTLNGKDIGQARSGIGGAFQRTFTMDLDAGTYTIIASWTGTHLFFPNSSATVVQVKPAVVRIQTVPAVAGVPFAMAGQRFISGEDGYATVKINRVGQFLLTVLVDQYHNETQRIKFSRWLDESYVPTSTISVPSDRVVQVGLDIFRPVGQSFLDLDGFPVDPERITEFMIRSAQGDVFIFHDGQVRWIPASRIARRSTGLQETKLLYSVISVTIDGSNVVNQAQQRFYTFPTGNWPISLLLYSLHITAKDGLFGTPVGKSVNLVFPDGRAINYPLDKNGAVMIHSLARGNYSTELVGTMGLSNKLPVALSRNQDVNTSVITYLDLALTGFLAALVALGLLLYGRLGLRFVLRKSKQPLLPEPQWVLSSPIDLGPEEKKYDYHSMRYENVRSFDDEEFKQSFGVERMLFEKMLSFLESDMHNIGRQTKLSPADQLLLTIVYLREHPSKLEFAPTYGVSPGTIRRSIKRVINSLLKSEEFNFANSFLQHGRPLLATEASTNRKVSAIENQADIDSSSRPRRSESALE